MGLPKFFGLYDLYEGFRSKETEMKAREHMSPRYKKIYLIFDSWIKSLMLFAILMVIAYFIFKYQTDFMDFALRMTLVFMIALCVTKQIMRKIIRGKYNI